MIEVNNICRTRVNSICRTRDTKPGPDFVSGLQIFTRSRDSQEDFICTVSF